MAGGSRRNFLRTLPIDAGYDAVGWDCMHDKALLWSRWYPTVEEGNKKGLLLIVTTAKDGALTGGPQFTKVTVCRLHILPPHPRHNRTLASRKRHSTDHPLHVCVPCDPLSPLKAWGRLCCCECCGDHRQCLLSRHRALLHRCRDT